MILSIILSSVFLTAKPSQCSLVSARYFPWQKKVWCSLFISPLSGRLVSCRAAMSTFSRCCSIADTAVLRTLSTAWRSSFSPGHVIPHSKLQSEELSLHFTLSLLAWCVVNDLLVGQVVSERQAPTEVGRSWLINTLLAEGCLG